MSQQTEGLSAPSVQVTRSRLQPFISNCYRPALKKLGQVFQASSPAAVLISEGRFAPAFIIDQFLGALKDEVVVVRLRGPYTDSTSCMQQIVEGVGLLPGNLKMSELEGVLEMFLAYQRRKCLRTVFCFENLDTDDWWVRDQIQRLIDLETNEKFGLLIVQADRPNGESGIAEPLRDQINQQGVKRIVLSPFTLAETRNFIRQRIELPDVDDVPVDDVGQIFEFFAVTLIHEFSTGVPEYVEQLCDKCLQLMRNAGDHEVSTDTVRAAARILNMGQSTVDARIDTPDDIAINEVSRPGRLVVQSGNEVVMEIPLDQNCIMIGRDPLCGLCISGLNVSRYHAFVALSSHGVQLVDLSSTNGTNVNGVAIDRCTLRDNDTISIDQFKVRYVAGGEQLACAIQDPTNGFEICDETPQPSITRIDTDIQLLRTTWQRRKASRDGHNAT